MIMLAMNADLKVFPPKQPRDRGVSNLDPPAANCVSDFIVNRPHHRHAI